jgi:hypothetical protein
MNRLPTHSPPPKEEATGLPLLHTWKGVYVFVLATFALWIALLIALTKAFS